MITTTQVAQEQWLLNKLMCYNCGCGVKTDDMGRGRVSKGGASLTEDDIKDMAEKWGLSVEETKKNILDMLKSEVGNK